MMTCTPAISFSCALFISAVGLLLPFVWWLIFACSCRCFTEKFDLEPFAFFKARTRYDLLSDFRYRFSFWIFVLQGTVIIAITGKGGAILFVLVSIVPVFVIIDTLSSWNFNRAGDESLFSYSKWTGGGEDAKRACSLAVVVMGVVSTNYYNWISALFNIAFAVVNIESHVSYIRDHRSIISQTIQTHMPFSYIVSHLLLPVLFVVGLIEAVLMIAFDVCAIPLFIGVSPFFVARNEYYLFKTVSSYELKLVLWSLIPRRWVPQIIKVKLEEEIYQEKRETAIK